MSNDDVYKFLMETQQDNLFGSDNENYISPSERIRLLNESFRTAILFIKNNKNDFKKFKNDLKKANIIITESSDGSYRFRERNIVEKKNRPSYIRDESLFISSSDKLLHFEQSTVGELGNSTLILTTDENDKLEAVMGQETWSDNTDFTFTVDYPIRQEDIVIFTDTTLQFNKKRVTTSIGEFAQVPPTDILNKTEIFIKKINKALGINTP
ncbi:MAG: hypothetical protein WCJ19_02975 [bacterium]